MKCVPTVRIINNRLFRLHISNLITEPVNENQSVTTIIEKKLCWPCSSNIFDSNDKTICKHIEKCQSHHLSQVINLNHFEKFGFQSQFNINDDLLDKRFKILQMELHPDKFATKSLKDREESSIVSSSINIAYKTLKSPIERANYMIFVKYGIKDYLDDESAYTLASASGDLILEIFSLREEINDSNNAENLNKLLLHVQEKFKNSCENFSKSLESSSKHESLELIVKLNYYWRAITELREKINGSHV